MRERVVRELRKSMRMDDKHSHIHTTPLAFALTVSCFFCIALPHSHSQPSPPPSLCSQQSYICNIRVSVIFDPPWENIPPSQCNGADPSSLLSCHAHYESQNFTVKDIDNTTHTMKLMPRPPVDHVCSTHLFYGYQNFDYDNFNNALHQYNTPVHKIIIFDHCPTIPNFPSKRNFTCGDVLYYFEEGNTEKEILDKYPPLKDCNGSLNVPAAGPLDHYYDTDDGAGVLEEALNDAFEVNYSIPDGCRRCRENDGSCFPYGYDEHLVSCSYCPNEQCSLQKRRVNWRMKTIIGVCSGVGGALIVGLCVYIFIRRRKNSYVMSYIQSRSLSSDPSSKDTEKGSHSFTQSIIPGVHLFSYEELEEATNYFDPSKELGEGGFGTVYFGKLRDGRSVAVKRLYENNYRRVAQFMNEIKILTRIDHPNLVKLYGCTSRHSRELLLVYEYIPNGTVADHIHGERSKPGTLPWHIRMNIAVETASALKFLHLRDIIHRDVKTNNILLDSNFRVKVADFGLSRLFPDHVTHVSTAPQGTPGYVDPEYHECYQLTNKSDVYSFGVVLVEMISSLPAVDITRHRHEINLANMAINKIHNQTLQELVDPNLGFESDFKVRKMISGVAELAFQCLQSSKEMRPSMEEVVETLKDIQSDGKSKSQPEVMDISSTSDDVVLLKDDPPPPSPDSNAVSKTTTPNTSG
ncbi:LEAF RUST 10 DISEASE-RESISTANCE LOCUS RECEPTOR-LIKE PROTEIN KINASE-like 1.2 isoform X2 [Vigna radiata var. radiata]|uniref:LEAF RUST 10 DISEASE-RESISTANCE LOCUS RECEPTOR-LIKE PROTEIN KINASE-like 1.2 isoform X2 n=1 Tax=Vigna radiata var. radiata TaxID=3916 RepID=A0A1S3V370_VIGRR|nr:LEAF RUST 10 DISEASE-RESISTANCE LOCUS RECEPTOR-LIKE PROTEIN KINASE-like 1.2 isoform X2 [Vigna radiata var. radiata]